MFETTNFQTTALYANWKRVIFSLVLCLLLQTCQVSRAWQVFYSEFLGEYDEAGRAHAQSHSLTVAIDSYEVVTASATGEIMVDQTLRLSQPLRDLGVWASASPETWLEHLGLEQASLISATFEQDMVHLQYKFAAKDTAQSYLFMLPSLPVASLAEATLLQYTLPLAISRQIEIQVPGIFTDLSGPIVQQWGPHNYFILESKFHTLNHVSVRQLVIVNEPSLPALQALRAGGLPAIHVRYWVISSSFQVTWPYHLALGTILLVSVTSIGLLTSQSVRVFHLNFLGLNIFLAFTGFLVGGGMIWLSLISGFQSSIFTTQIPNFTLRLLFDIFVASSSWPLLMVIGFFLCYWAISTLFRAAWTRWTALCLLATLSVYLYSLTFWLLPFQELIEQQRLILIFTIFLFSTIIVPIFSTMMQPDPTYYIRE